MAFGSFLDKAKDSANAAADKAKDSANAAADKAKDSANKAKDSANSAVSVATEKAGNISGLISSMIDDINAALPVLSDNGYKMNEFEMELGLIPSFKPHFVISEELTEEKQVKILAALEGNKVATLLVKSLAQAAELQKTIKVGNLKFAEVEIEASLPPKVTLKFQ